MLTEYLEMLPVSLGPPQGWDTNTVRWGENFRKENSKGWRWGENTKDMNQRNPAVSLPSQLLQTVFLYPLARYTEFTKLFSNHIYGEIFHRELNSWASDIVKAPSLVIPVAINWCIFEEGLQRVRHYWVTELNWTAGSGKEPDAGRAWGQEEKGMTEDEMAG